MLTMLAMLANMAAVAVPVEGQLHPSLVVERAAVETAWDRGYADGAKRKDTNGPARRFERNLGISSVIELEDPRLAAYRLGFQARKSPPPGKTPDELRKSGIDLLTAGSHSIKFEGHLVVEPRVDGPLSLPGDPKDLTGVGVELQVAGRTYSPRKQPGDLVVRTETVTERYEAPLRPIINERADRRDRVVIHRDRPEDLPGVEKETRRDSGKGIPAKARVYQVHKGDFVVEFDLLDADGSPRITDKDKEMVLLVFLRSGRQSVTYKLADLARPVP